eukprot:gnl/MRDRNA2_/MRDRNA2_90771_c0_seq1.p1 gnl/MRDRNA2_/MRDRNA2_90771_c0~~gnl/MRDRNA2_/MRDRNA2_90771_c0_seq1.p1  ORF type:complete len:241 (+),score=60.30 gnl/MRDRNA2_/MRDRNA2_90771_c0_seq1:114-836(+)
MPIIPEEPLKGLPKDFGKMKNEVAEAARGDWKHGMVDDAKKKAIYAAKDYNDFKQRVAGCTLKPITRNEFNAPPKFAFNRSAASNSSSKSGGYAAQDTAKSTLSAGKALPKNGRLFDKEWRRLTSLGLPLADKVDLLVKIADAGIIPEVFGKELDPELLLKILQLLDNEEAVKDAPEGFPQIFTRKLAESCKESLSNAVAFFGADDKALLVKAMEGKDGTSDESDQELLKSIGVVPAAAK